MLNNNNESHINNMDLWDLMKNMDINILAKIFYDLEPNKYLYSKYTGWYYYEYNNILLIKKRPPNHLFHSIPSKLQSIFNIEKNKLIKPIDLNDNIENKLYEDKIKIVEKACSIIIKYKFTFSIIDKLKYLYLIEDLDEKLDNNINIIAFNDKLYDIILNKYRNIEKTDYITKTCQRYAPENKFNKIKREKILEILYSTFENNNIVDFWLKVISVSLFSNKYENFYFLMGSNPSGRGLLFKLLKTRICKSISKIQRIANI